MTAQPLLVFAFGEGDCYLYSGPEGCARHGLPHEVEALFQDVHTPLTAIYNVAFGSGGSYFISFRYTGPDGESVDDYRCHNLPIDLRVWLESKIYYGKNKPSEDRSVKPSRFGRDLPTTRISLGPNDSWSATDARSSGCGNLPRELMRYFVSTHRTPNRRTYCIALGYGGAYFWMGMNYLLAYNLKGSSEGLDEFMDSVRNKSDHFSLEYIAVSPFDPNRYLVFFADGNFFASIPDSWRPQCDAVSASTAAFLTKHMPSHIRPLTRPDELASFLKSSSEEEKKLDSGNVKLSSGAASALNTSGQTIPASMTITTTAATPSDTVDTSNAASNTAAEVSSFHTNTAPDAALTAHVTNSANTADTTQGTTATLAQTLGIFHIGDFGGDMTNMNTVSYAVTGDSYGHYSYGGGGDAGGAGGGV